MCRHRCHGQTSNTVDFNANTQRYGPRSGTTEVERLCVCYRYGLLLDLPPGVERLVLCRKCGDEGHFAGTCPVPFWDAGAPDRDPGYDWWPPEGIRFG